MLQFLTLAISAIALSASAAPVMHTKRINQVITESTAKWEKACIAAGGGLACNPVSVTAFSTLLANAPSCAQQDAADEMVALAKTLTKDVSEMIRLAQIFVQQPRNSPTSLSVPYCDTAPKSTELAGLYQCQFAGVNPKTFVGNLAAGAKGTLPVGVAQISPPGSCPAHPAGPIPDGQQLVNISNSPGAGGAAPTGAISSALPSATSVKVVSSTSAAASASSTAVVVAPTSVVSATATTSAAEETATASPDPKDDCEGDDEDSDDSADDSDDSDDSSEDDDCTDDETDPTGTASEPVAAPTEIVTSQLATSTAVSSPASPTSSAVPDANFKRQNGLDAQALNTKFSSLTENSPCTDGDQACVNGAFAQCVGGKFVTQSCGTTLICAVLPLVNKAGTSITCTTSADRDARIATALGS